MLKITASREECKRGMDGGGEWTSEGEQKGGQAEYARRRILRYKRSPHDGAV